MYKHGKISCIFFVLYYKTNKKHLPYKKRIADISENWKKAKWCKIPRPSGDIFPNIFPIFQSSTFLYRTVYQHEKCF